MITWEANSWTDSPSFHFDRSESWKKVQITFECKVGLPLPKNPDEYSDYAPRANLPSELQERDPQLYESSVNNLQKEIIPKQQVTMTTGVADTSSADSCIFTLEQLISYTLSITRNTHKTWNLLKNHFAGCRSESGIDLGQCMLLVKFFDLCEIFSHYVYDVPI